MIAADTDRIPARHLLGSIGKDISDQAHRRFRRINVRATRHILFQNIVLNRARELGWRHSLFLRYCDIQRQERRGRGIDRHGGTHLMQRNVFEQGLHILEGSNGNPNFADLARCHGMI